MKIHYYMLLQVTIVQFTFIFVLCNKGLYIFFYLFTDRHAHICTYCGIKITIFNIKICNTTITAFFNIFCFILLILIYYKIHAHTYAYPHYYYIIYIIFHKVNEKISWV